MIGQTHFPLSDGGPFFNGKALLRFPVTFPLSI